MKKLLLAFVAVFVMLGCQTKPIDAATTSKVHYISVGQGDSSLIQYGNHYVMIDAGHGRGYDDACVNYLKSKGVKTLDDLIFTHCDADHINDGADVLSSVNVKKIYMSARTSSSVTYKNLLLKIKSKGLKITVPSVGTKIKIGKASITFLGVGTGATNNNDSSLCMRYSDTYHKFVFTGDASASMEAGLSSSSLKCDVFQAGHHGSRYANSDYILSAMKAKYVVVSCGKNNSYGHPHSEALKRFASHHMKVYRTDLKGTVICTSKKGSLTFNVKASASTGSSSSSSASSTTKVKYGTYYASKVSKKYHRASCRYVKSIKSANLVTFKSTAEVKKAGYKACKVCNP